jgi:hypothetical protein
MLGLLAAFAWVRFMQRRVDRGGDLRALGLASVPRGWVRFALGVAGGAVLAGVLVALAFAGGDLQLGPSHWRVEGGGDVAIDLIGALIVLVCALVGEELIFRGYLTWTSAAMACLGRRAVRRRRVSCASPLVCPRLTLAAELRAGLAPTRSPHLRRRPAGWVRDRSDLPARRWSPKVLHSRIARPSHGSFRPGVAGSCAPAVAAAVVPSSLKQALIFL